MTTDLNSHPISANTPNGPEEMSTAKMKQKNIIIGVLAVGCIVFAGLAGWLVLDARQAQARFAQGLHAEYAEKLDRLQLERNRFEASEGSLIKEIQRRDAEGKAHKEAAEKREQEKSLSARMPMRADQPIRSLPADKIPASFAWLAHLPFGVSERQFSETFTDAKCFASDGDRTCAIENVSYKCFEGIDAPCKTVLATFSDSAGLVSLLVDFEYWPGFSGLVDQASAAFGAITDGRQIDMRPQGIQMTGAEQRWVIPGGVIQMGIQDGVNANGRKYRSQTFSVKHTGNRS